MSAPAWAACLAGPALRWFVVVEQGAPRLDQGVGLWGFQLAEGCEHAFVQGAGQYVIQCELSRWGCGLMRLMMLWGSDNFWALAG
ncbi:hypothetical protein GCM10011609_21970 [Lentzea pudingi]|uniref:Uncharacterized protein n=1 Tax=Lentzea pudingi TaxID=1789439 RepID=A0ABQ2HN35_9PSEU|nr:hypothetical protein GCM10011609_21970 [Lentzea pudingi]